MGLHVTRSASLIQKEQKCDIVCENNYLPMSRLIHQTTSHGLSVHMVE